MTSSLPVIDDPAQEQDQSMTTPPPARGPLETRNAAVDEARWDAWVLKGRRADAAFTEKVRMLALLGVTVGVAAGTVWIFLG
jgi:hypothetical protein